MPAYMNGQKIAGAYLNGHKVNGFINGVKLFNNMVTINCKLNGASNNVVQSITLTVDPQDGFKPKYDLNVPQTIYDPYIDGGYNPYEHVDKGSLNVAQGFPFINGQTVDVFYIS